MTPLPRRSDHLNGLWPALEPVVAPAATPLPVRTPDPPRHPRPRIRRTRVIGGACALAAAALWLAQPGERHVTVTDTRSIETVTAPATNHTPAFAPAAPDPAPSRTGPAKVNIGAHLWGGWRGSTTIPRDIREAIAKGRLGGIVLFADNVATPTPEAYRALAGELRALARRTERTPPLIAIDQEGGAVRRIAGPPEADAAAQRGDWYDRFVAGRRTGAMLHRAGIDIDLAPVADVATAGSIMARRSYAPAPQDAAIATAAMVAGLQHEGVAATVKHFPGLGMATRTTDEVPVTLAASRERLARDWAPFHAAIASGAQLVMLSTATYPAFDPDRPAALSAPVVRLLRKTFGFHGVCVTDALDTPALHGDVGARAVDALRAGCDIALFTASAGDGAYKAIESALADGTLKPKALRRSDARLKALR